ncbi:MAG: DNA repair protein RecO [Pseudomonadota bacterium]
MAEHLTPAFVLHRRPYTDTSLLLELYTPNAGRLPAIARGARSPAARGSWLQPFQPLLVQWRGRGDVKTLSRFEARGNPLALHGRRLYCGVYINELMLRLVPREDPADELFVAYEQTLRDLVTTPDIESLLRHFEVRLLKSLGYALPLDRTVAGESVEAQGYYRYSVEMGPEACGEADAGVVKGQTLLSLAHRHPLAEKRLRQEARNLMRRVLDHYLDYKPLKSRELFKPARQENRES